MFHVFRARKTPLLKLADAFFEKAKADLLKMEALISELIVEADSSVKSALLLPNEEGQGFAVFFIQRNSALMLYRDLEEGSPRTKSRSIKTGRSTWLDNTRKLLTHDKKEEVEESNIKLLTTLLQLHTVLDTILYKIEGSYDETGIVKFEALNKTYRTLLREIAPFKKMANCFPYYNEIDSNLTVMQTEYIALNAKASCCYATREGRRAKMEMQTGNALASFEGAINKAANCEQNLTVSDTISRSFSEFEKEIERSSSSSSRRLW